MELLSEQLTVEGVELLINSGQVDIQSADGVELLVSCGARGHISAARALCASLRRRSLQIELLLTSKSLPRFLLLLRRLPHNLQSVEKREKEWEGADKLTPGVSALNGTKLAFCAAFVMHIIQCEGYSGRDATCEEGHEEHTNLEGAAPVQEGAERTNQDATAHIRDEDAEDNPEKDIEQHRSRKRKLLMKAMWEEAVRCLGACSSMGESLSLCLAKRLKYFQAMKQSGRDSGSVPPGLTRKGMLQLQQIVHATQRHLIEVVERMGLGIGLAMRHRALSTLALRSVTAASVQHLDELSAAEVGSSDAHVLPTEGSVSSAQLIPVPAPRVRSPADELVLPAAIAPSPNETHLSIIFRAGRAHLNGSEFASGVLSHLKPQLPPPFQAVHQVTPVERAHSSFPRP
jgi:hypothetical protein